MHGWLALFDFISNHYNACIVCVRFLNFWWCEPAQLELGIYLICFLMLRRLSWIFSFACGCSTWRLQIFLHELCFRSLNAVTSGIFLFFCSLVFLSVSPPSVSSFLCFFEFLLSEAFFELQVACIVDWKIATFWWRETLLTVCLDSTPQL